MRPSAVLALLLASFAALGLLGGPDAGADASADERSAPVVPATQGPVGNPVAAEARPEREEDLLLTARVRALVDDAIESAKRASKGLATRANTFVSVSVRELGTDGALVAIGDERSVRPASNMKLATTAAALVMLGGDWRFETGFEAAGPVEGGVLRGDLVVRAGADPLYDHAARGDVDHLLAPFVDELRAQGIDRVTGDLVLDQGSFPDPAPGPGWPDPSQHWKDYCALVAGFTANGGCITAEITPRAPGEAALRRVRPREIALPLRGRVRTGTANSRLDVRIGATTVAATVTGTIPAGLEPRVYRFRHPDPVQLFGAVLAGALEEGGVTVEGGVVLERGRPPGEPLATLRSPLVPLLEPINTDSDNAIADQVFLALGHEVTGEGTRAAGARAVGIALERLGLETDGWVQVDGSGLSRDDRITARQLTALIDAVLSLDPALAQAWLDSLAVAGRSGTLEDRMRDTPAENRVRAKTGWIRGASALSGVAEARGGRLLVFSILVDYPARAGGLNTAVFKPMHDAICNLLVEWEGPER